MGCGWSDPCGGWLWRLKLVLKAMLVRGWSKDSDECCIQQR